MSAINNSFVLKLHVKTTASLLLFFFGFIFLHMFCMSNQIIDCVVNKESNFSSSSISSICVQDIFIYKSAIEKQVGVEVAYPGIGNPEPGEQKQRLQYYQNIYLFLLFQSLCFALPGLIWNKIDVNLKPFRLMNRFSNIEKDSDEYYASQKKLFNTFRENEWTFRLYSISILAFLVFNLANLLLQVYLTDLFLNNSFIDYGLDIIRKGEFETPTNLRFPDQALCIYNYLANETRVDSSSYTCALKLNGIHSIAFLFLWVWYLCLAVYTAISIVVHLLLIVCSIIIYGSNFQSIFFLLREMRKDIREDTLLDLLKTFNKN